MGTRRRLGTKAENALHWCRTCIHICKDKGEILKNVGDATDLVPHLQFDFATLQSMPLGDLKREVKTAIGVYDIDLGVARYNIGRGQRCFNARSQALEAGGRT